MKLDQYLQNHGISISKAAKELGVSSEAVRLWANCKRCPAQDLMSKIYNWSHGHVTPNDFYDLPPLPSMGAGETVSDGGRPRSPSDSPLGGALAPSLDVRGAVYDPHGGLLPSHGDCPADSQGGGAV